MRRCPVDEFLCSDCQEIVQSKRDDGTDGDCADCGRCRECCTARPGDSCDYMFEIAAFAPI